MKEYLVKELNAATVGEVEVLYSQFVQNAELDYKFDIPPVPYSDFAFSVENSFINGFLLYENNLPAGFLLYAHEEESKAIELNIIHIANKEDLYPKRKNLLQALIDKYKDQTDWTVISYPMLGIQQSFAREIVDQKFGLVGQMMVRFDFLDQSFYKVLLKMEVPALQNGYEIVSWDDKYADKMPEIVQDAFSGSNDVKFDPRFETVDGCTEIVGKIVNNVFGEFVPAATSVVLYNGEPVGVCFINSNAALSANIPIIAIKQEHRKSGMGKHLIKNSMIELVKIMAEGKFFAKDITAAVDTDNHIAVRMYRRAGFKELFWYPHAYLKNCNYKL